MVRQDKQAFGNYSQLCEARNKNCMGNRYPQWTVRTKQNTSDPLIRVRHSVSNNTAMCEATVSHIHKSKETSIPNCPWIFFTRRQQSLVFQLEDNKLRQLTVTHSMYKYCISLKTRKQVGRWQTCNESRRIKWAVFTYGRLQWPVHTNVMGRGHGWSSLMVTG